MTKKLMLQLLLIAIFFSVSHGLTTPVVPCILLQNSICTRCLATYYLQDGKCYFNTACPARKYHYHGGCFDVNPLCGDFDLFTGFCKTCADPLNYNLIADYGICIVKVVCGLRRYRLNGLCYDVSQSCGQFEPFTGKCKTCANNLLGLNPDGTCTLIVLNCPARQYQKGLFCVSIPGECLQFNVRLQKCITCIRGYEINTNGICRIIACPPRYFSSRFGSFCQEVSILCDEYDELYGDCLTCKTPGYQPSDGICKQAVSPLVSCKAKQQLGYGTDCINNLANCKTYDLNKSQCFECLSNFYLNFNFRCVPKPICATTQYLINNQCRDIPQNCLRINEFGTCLQCVSNDFRLVVSQCVVEKRCQADQFLNQQGVCINLSSQCIQYNPTFGLCITCRNGARPQQGICCPIGLSLVGEICVNSNVLQLSYQYSTDPNCLIRHPFAPICVKCSQGYEQYLIIPYGCKKSK